MKAVVLLAGMGRRIMEGRAESHKALICLDEKPSLFYLLENIKKSGINDCVLVLGYNGDKLLENIKGWDVELNYIIKWNTKYMKTNNLFSLYQAKDVLLNNDFVIINGDLVFDYKILEGILKCNGTSIALDTERNKMDIDSPKIRYIGGRIRDLGRHISIEENYGYAIGIYKFDAKITKDFFEEAAKMLKDDLNRGFHDPLIPLFDKYSVTSFSTNKKIWTDIDEISDIEKAENYLRRIHNGESF